MPKVLFCDNPFRPQLSRELVTVRAGTRIDTMLRARGAVSGRGAKVVRNHVFVVQVNGEYLLQVQWVRRIETSDVVAVFYLPGDGGNGGSNPLRTLLQVALVVASAWVPAALGLQAGAAAAMSAGIIIGGNLLLNAVLPPPTPNLASGREQASPSYGINAQGNRARLFEAIPVLYGRFRVYPDFAAEPYTELDGNQQYLYQLFGISQGEIDIEEVRIEDTPIGNFAEVQYEVIRPGGKVTLFPDNVVTSNAVQGLELKGPNEADGGAVGPFVANPADSRANKIAIDIAFPAGLYRADDKGDLNPFTVSWDVLAQPIDNAGNAVGEWFLLGSESYRASTATPQAKTYRYTVPEGRYQVRAQRTSNKQTDTRYGNVLQWVGMRAYLPSQQSYGNLTMLAVVMRATNNLNQSTARRINVIATRKLKTWNPVDGWSLSTKATRSPAWAIADACANKEYGRGLVDSRINLNELYRLAQVWESRGDEFNGVFDTTTTFWDALTKIARVGRARPMYYAGVIDIVRNEPRTVPTAMFTPKNIVAESFSVDYKFMKSDSPDHVVVSFINEETWQPEDVACVLPGGTQERPYTVELTGCTNRPQAWREGISMAAANRDQRRFPHLSSELDGLLPKYLDLVAITHDVPKWGLSGFVRGYNPATRVLSMSEPLEWWIGENHYLSLRMLDGSVRGPFLVTQGEDEFSAVLASALPADVEIASGDTEEPTYYQFGPGEKRALNTLALSATPDENGRVALTFVNYADSVHTAELGGEVPPPPPPSLLPSKPGAPIVNEVTVFATSVAGVQQVSCTPARGATAYEFQASNDQGTTWMPLGTLGEPSTKAQLSPGVWWIRARGIGTLPGAWKTWQGQISATMLPPPTLTSLTAIGQVMGIDLHWIWPSGINLRAIEIYRSMTNSFVDAQPLGTFAYPQASHSITGLANNVAMYFWARVRDEADQPGPWYPGELGVRGQSSADPTPLLSYMEGKIGAGQLAPGLIEEIQAGITDEVMKDILGDLTGADVQDHTWFAGDSDRSFVGTVSATSVINEGDFREAMRSISLAAKTEGNLAVIREELRVTANLTSVTAQQMLILTGRVGENEATLQETRGIAVGAQGTASAAQQLAGNAKATADSADLLATTTKLALSSTWMLKAQVRQDGRVVQAGVALGASIGENGQSRSEFLVMADTVAFLTSLNGKLHSPFIFDVAADTAYFDTAFIKNGTIGSGKFVDELLSDATDSQGRPLLYMNMRTGQTTWRTQGASGERTEMGGTGFRWYYPNGQLGIRLGGGS